MRKYVWIAPLLLLAGCTRTTSTSSSVSQEKAQPTASAVSEPAASREAEAKPSPLEAERAEVVIPKGTALRARIDETIDTRRNRAGDQFHGSLAEPVVLDGKAVLPKGTRLVGHVTESQASGRMEGRAFLAITLDSFQLDGKEYRIHTSSIDRQSASHKKRNLLLIGGGSGFGAMLGAIAGGGKGALIGAGAGAAAGTAGAAATGKRQVAIAAESLVTFALREPVQL